MLFEAINKNIKNLEINPNKGGIPANDNNIITINVVINGKLPKNFKSFKVFIYFKSNKKKIIKMFIKIKM